MCLNHPQTIPRPLVCGKMVFHETGPWCPKGWGPLIHTCDQSSGDGVERKGATAHPHWRGERGQETTRMTAGGNGGIKRRKPQGTVCPAEPGRVIWEQHQGTRRVPSCLLIPRKGCGGCEQHQPLPQGALWCTFPVLQGSLASLPAPRCDSRKGHGLSLPPVTSALPWLPTPHSQLPSTCPRLNIQLKLSISRKVSQVSLAFLSHSSDTILTCRHSCDVLFYQHHELPEGGHSLFITISPYHPT